MDHVGLLAGFLRDQERRGLLPRTIEKRRILLRCFIRWCEPRSVFELSAADVELFLDSRRGSPKTRHNWISHLHVFYAWAVRERITSFDPTAEIVRPKLRRALPRPAETGELADGIKRAGPELRAWIVLAAYCGLRVQEIAGLRREDVIESEGLLRVTHAKGGYERIVPLHPAVLACLVTLPMPRQGWVFRRPQGGPYPPHRLSVRFRQGLLDVGITSSPHTLRHWYASALYRQTHDLRLVQELLGHASPATTAIYTAFDREGASRAVELLSFDVA